MAEEAIQLVLPGNIPKDVPDQDTDAVVSPTPLLIRYARWLLTHAAMPWLCVLVQVTAQSLRMVNEVVLNTGRTELFSILFAISRMLVVPLMATYFAVRRVTRADGQLAQLGVGTTKFTAAAASSIIRLHGIMVVFVVLFCSGIPHDVAAGLTGTPVPIGREGGSNGQVGMLNGHQGKTGLVAYQRVWALLQPFNGLVIFPTIFAWLVAIKEASVLASDAVIETRKLIHTTAVNSAEWNSIVVPRVIGLIRETMPALSTGFGTSVLGCVLSFWMATLAGFVEYLIKLDPASFCGVFVMLALSALPVKDVASASSDCDAIHESLNDKRCVQLDLESDAKIQLLEQHLDRLNKKQGLGFVAGGKVIDRTTLKTTFAAIGGFLGFIVPLLLAFHHEAAVVGTDVCSFDAGQVRVIKGVVASAGAGANSTSGAACSFDNVTIGSVLRLKTDDTLVAAAPVQAASASSTGGLKSDDAAASAVNTTAWQGRTVYFVMGDRFAAAPGETLAPCGNGTKEWCGGKLSGVMSKLDYIKGMGFDAIWVSPVVEQVPWRDNWNGTGYHGYWARDFMKIDAHYGTAADLKALSRECHKRGLLLMLDVVANHVGPIHSVAQLQQLGPELNSSHGEQIHTLGRNKSESLGDYIADPITMNQAGNRPYGSGKPGACWPNYDFGGGCNYTVILDGWFGDLADLRQENPATAQYLLKWIAYMVKTYELDGLRLDTVSYVPKPFLKRFQQSANRLIVGEVVSANVTMHREFASVITSLLNFPLALVHKGTQVWAPNGSMAVLTKVLMEQKEAKYPAPGLLGQFVDNHDGERFLADHPDNVQYENALVFTMLHTGLPIIYQGTENPQLASLQDQRTAMWPFFDASTPLYAFFAKLNKLRKTYGLGVGGADARAASNIASVVSGSAQNMLLFARGDVLVQLSNLGANASARIAPLCVAPSSLGERFIMLCTGSAPGWMGKTLHGNATVVCKNWTLCVQPSDGRPSIFSLKTLDDFVSVDGGKPPSPAPMPLPPQSFRPSVPNGSPTSRINLASDTAWSFCILHDWSISNASGKWLSGGTCGAHRSIRVPGGGFNSDLQSKPWISATIGDSTLTAKEVDLNSTSAAEYRRTLPTAALGRGSTESEQLDFSAVNYGALIFLQSGSSGPELIGSHHNPLVPFAVRLPAVLDASTPHELIVQVLPYERFAGMPSCFTYPDAGRTSSPSLAAWGGCKTTFCRSKFAMGIIKSLSVAMYRSVHVDSVRAWPSHVNNTLRFAAAVRNDGTAAATKQVLRGDLSQWQAGKAKWTYPRVPDMLVSVPAGGQVVVSATVPWALPDEALWMPNKPFNESYEPALHWLNFTLTSSASEEAVKHSFGQRFGFVEWRDDLVPTKWTANGVAISFVSDVTPESGMSHYDCYAQSEAFRTVTGVKETWKRYMRLGVFANRIHQSTPTEAMLTAADEVGFCLRPETGIRGGGAHDPEQTWSDEYSPQSVQELARACLGHASVFTYSVQIECDPAWVPALVDAIVDVDDSVPLVWENGPHHPTCPLSCDITPERRGRGTGQAGRQAGSSRQHSSRQGGSTARRGRAGRGQGRGRQQHAQEAGRGAAGVAGEAGRRTGQAAGQRQGSGRGSLRAGGRAAGSTQGRGAAQGRGGRHRGTELRTTLRWDSAEGPEAAPPETTSLRIKQGFSVKQKAMLTLPKTRVDRNLRTVLESLRDGTVVYTENRMSVRIKKSALKSDDEGTLPRDADRVRLTAANSAERCFRTVQQCVDEAIATNDGSGARCHLSAGTYRESVTVLAGAPVTISGPARGPPAVMTGAVLLPKTGWTLHKGSIWKTTLPAALQGLGAKTGRPRVQQVFVGSEHAFEARWPNAHGVASMFSSVSWANTSNSSAPTNATNSSGWLRSAAMAESGLDFSGGLLTLQAGTRVWTWTRNVSAHNVGNPIISYFGQLVPEKGGASKLEELFFVSGVLSALDAPMEWWSDGTELYLWAPEGGSPAALEVSVKSHDLCIDSKNAKMQIKSVTLTACTFSMQNCKGCGAANVSLRYPSYSRELGFRQVPMQDSSPDVPTVTLVDGNSSSLENIHVRDSQLTGLLLLGSGHAMRNALLENVNWLGSLDFPALQIGFGKMQCAHGHHFKHPSFDPSSCGHDLATRRVTRAGRRLHGVLGSCAPQGEGNTITKVTVRNCGGGSIVTSQLSNEVSYCHISNGTMIGLDQAGLHADNLNAHTPELCANSNCTKSWHHNWVYNQREKGIRGDDGTLNTTIAHSVVFNCGGKGPAYLKANRASGCGIMIKGDYNNINANTIYEVGDQGDLVVDTRKGPPCGSRGCIRENNHSTFTNTAARRVTGKHNGTPLNATAKDVCGLIHGLNLTELRLVNASAFDFRPAEDSPLRGAGCLQQRDVGAYQSGDPSPWRPGCDFSSRCKTDDQVTAVPKHTAKSDDEATSPPLLVFPTNATPNVSRIHFGNVAAKAECIVKLANALKVSVAEICIVWAKLGGRRLQEEERRQERRLRRRAASRSRLRSGRARTSKASSTAALAGALKKQGVAAKVSEPAIETEVKFEVAATSQERFDAINNAVSDKGAVAQALQAEGAAKGVSVRKESGLLVTSGFSCRPGSTKTVDGTSCVDCDANTFNTDGMVCMPRTAPLLVPT